AQEVGLDGIRLDVRQGDGAHHGQDRDDDQQLGQRVTTVAHGIARVEEGRRPLRRLPCVRQRLAAAFWTPSPALRKGWSFAKFFSPMPWTFMTSWTVLKPPDFCRYSTMRAASFSPTPGSVTSCCTVAVLTLTFPVGAGLASARTRPVDARNAKARATAMAETRLRFMVSPCSNGRPRAAG